MNYLPQPLIRHFIAPLWAWYERSDYLKRLAEFERTQYYQRANIEEIQRGKLEKLLVYILRNNPGYLAYWKGNKFDPADAADLSKFRKIPELTKEALRNQRTEFVSEPYRDRIGKLIQKKTSGSTGTPITVYVTEEILQIQRGATWRHNRWAGWGIGDNVAAIWGNPDLGKNRRLYLRNLLLERHIPLDTLRMNSEHILNFYKEIVRKKARILFGHAHSLYLFADFVEKENLTGWKPEGIVSTAMTLLGHERRKIEAVFGCKVTNRYGCEEVSLIASECERHEGLHINMENVLVEVVAERDCEVFPGEEGRIIVTDLNNFVTPIIRYDLGDVGSMTDRKCSCGRGLALLKNVNGRRADFLILPTGEYVSGISLTENFACSLPWLRRMQIVQETERLIRFRIEPSGKVKDSERAVLDELIERRFGDKVEVEVEITERLEPGPRGKHVFVINKLFQRRENAHSL